jgi:hypothetical protein
VGSDGSNHWHPSDHRRHSDRSPVPSGPPAANGLEVVGFLTILAVLAGGGLGLGLGFLTLFVAAAAGVGFAPVFVVLAIQALIIYGLVIHPATNQAFSR